MSEETKNEGKITAGQALANDLNILADQELMLAQEASTSIELATPEEVEKEIEPVEDITEESTDKFIRAEQKKLAAKAESRLAAQQEDILLNSQIKSATKKQKQNIYANTEVVYTIGDTPRGNTKQQIRNQQYNELLNSFRAKSPLTAIITGSEYINTYTTDKDGNRVKNQIPCASIRYGQFKIVIPYNELLKVPDELTGSKHEKLTYTRMLIDKELGAETDFIITGIDEVNCLATASRFAAMAIKKKVGYFDKNHATNNFNLNEGSIAEARIMYTTKAGIGVEVSGYDAFIPITELDYKTIADPDMEYQAGQIINVRIMKLKREIIKNEEGKKTYRLAAKFSAKAAMEDPRAMFIEQYDVGNKSYAVITNITAAGVFVRLEGMEGNIDCLCEFPGKGAQLMPGQRVIVYITKIDKENLRIRGKLSKW